MKIITTDTMSINCPHCGRVLETEGDTVRFGMDIVRCRSCGKFAKVETFARLLKIGTQPSVENYSEVVDGTATV
jgi:uncharacterized Zn finger protein